ncbi:MAG: hypothetical protein LBH46_01650 [Rickettsiales bacterium]|jgi:general secretion pathway protein D|nr:hypothetical protein [Rickettsiales bacterium]
MYKIFLICFLFLISCNRSVVDPKLGLTRKDFYDDFVVSNKSSISSNQAIPLDISQLLVVPPPPPIGNGELISLAVTEEVPIKDLLNELARNAGVDIELDPRVNGGIFLKVTKKPLEVVVQRIADVANLKYSYTDGILKFEPDTPYTKTYTLDFLIDNDIWGSVESDITTIVGIEEERATSMQDDSTPPPLDGVEQERKSPVKLTPKVFMNKSASAVTLYANSKTHEAVDKYLKIVRQNYSAQVLIEAKVVEIVLNDSFKMGVDWTSVMSNKGAFFVNGIRTGQISDSVVSASLNSGNLSAVINILEEFGTANTVSSPRISAINNQKANIDFTNKLVYFKMSPGKVEKDTDTGIVTSTPATAEKVEEEIGVKLTITPSINLKDNSVTLNVVPEMSVQKGLMEDPSIALAEASCAVNLCQGNNQSEACEKGLIRTNGQLCDLGDANSIPIIEKRALNTSLKIMSGNVLVIGGLLDDSSVSTERGLPILSSIPLIGNIFKTQSIEKKVTETVIFIKATIVRANDGLNEHNRNLLEKYTSNVDNYL